MTSLIQIFARAPLQGQVKTRIARELGDEAALHLHTQLCDRVIQVAQSCQADAVEIWTTEPHDFFDQFAAAVEIQQGRELGTRMEFALRHGLTRYDNVLVIGSDALSLTPDYLNQAINCLADVEVVFGPARDGGYVLVGARQVHTCLFRNMPWGTGDVMALTMERLLSESIPFQIMSEQWDIDTVDDLKRDAPDMLENLLNQEY